MKKGIFTLITISILLMLFYGCSGGSSGGSNNSDGEANNAVAENILPVADGGDDQTVFVGDVANLDGSGSYDPDKNYPLTYAMTGRLSPSRIEAHRFYLYLSVPMVLMDRKFL
jgi:hypothetical protein